MATIVMQMVYACTDALKATVVHNVLYNALPIARTECVQMKQIQKDNQFANLVVIMVIMVIRACLDVQLTVKVINAIELLVNVHGVVKMMQIGMTCVLNLVHQSVRIVHVLQMPGNAWMDVQMAGILINVISNVVQVVLQVHVTKRMEHVIGTA